jgi:hypothetical protein
MKLLDRGELIVVFRNTVNTYSAASISARDAPLVPISDYIARRGYCNQLDGGETPTMAMHNLTEHRLGTGPYQKQNERNRL